MDKVPKPVIFEILFYLPSLTQYGAVCRRWYQATHEEGLFRLLASPSCPLTPRADITLCQQYMTHSFHSAWRPSTQQLVVDFTNASITSLTMDEGNVSQIYYTYPCMVLQSTRKFSVYHLHVCRDLERIALKKGAHIRGDPVMEEGQYVCTCMTEQPVIKLDFFYKELTATLHVVAWTMARIEVFDISFADVAKLTIAERREKYRRRPIPRDRVLNTALSGHDIPSSMLILHVNEEGTVAFLSSQNSAIDFFQCSTGNHLGSTVVPGPLTADWTAAVSTDGHGEWKSRERFEFKGSTRVGAVRDDEGNVHVYDIKKKVWSTVGTDTRAPSLRPPKCLRAAADVVVMWYDGAPHEAYFEVWRLGVGIIMQRRYPRIVSVHIDPYRLYVQIPRRGAIGSNSDMSIDVWALNTCRPLSRCNVKMGSWFRDKEERRTLLTRLFWSDCNTLMYYELNHMAKETRNVLLIRQVSVINTEHYNAAVLRLTSDPYAEPPQRMEAIPVLEGGQTVDNSMHIPGDA